jgi:ribosome-associated protein
MSPKPPKKPSRKPSRKSSPSSARGGARAGGAAKAGKRAGKAPSRGGARAGGFKVSRGGKKPAKGTKGQGTRSLRGARPQKKAPLERADESLPSIPEVDHSRTRQIAERAVALCLDKKAADVVLLDVRGMTSYADYFVIASGDSERQVTATGDSLEQKLKEEFSARTIGTEGRETGNWVLLDYGEVVIHLFYAEVRAFYDLEGLWADAPRVSVA